MRSACWEESAVGGVGQKLLGGDVCKGHGNLVPFYTLQMRSVFMDTRGTAHDLRASRSHCATYSSESSCDTYRSLRSLEMTIGGLRRRVADRSSPEKIQGRDARGTSTDAG